MLSEAVVVAIVNAIGLIVAARISHPPTRGKRKILGLSPGGIVLILVLVDAGFLTWYLREHRPRPELEPRVEITGPDENQEVGVREMIWGKKSNVRVGQKIWLVVKPTDSDLYYPQGHSADDSSSSENTWEQEACMGREEDEGRQFVILACIVDGPAQQVFRQHGMSPCQDSIPQLPSNLICARRSVHRRKEINLPTSQRR